MPDAYPHHWRAGRGYIPPTVAKQPVIKDSTYYVPLPFTYDAPPFFGPLAGPFGFPLGPLLGFPAIPVYSQYPIGPPHSFYQAPPPHPLHWQCPPTPPADQDNCSVTSSGSDTSDDEAKTPTSTPPGTKLPMGLRRGFGLLFTGKPCHLAIIDHTHTTLANLLNPTRPARRITFSIFSVADNSTVKELILALGGAEKSSITQMWEWGNGFWKKGSKMEFADERSKQTLKDLGWSEAGSKGKGHVWLYFVKGMEK